MSTIPVFVPTDYILQVGNRLMTDSIRVAKAFGKRHKNVLRAIDRLGCGEEFARLNFEPADFIDKNGDIRRMVRMTKDGLMLLVMGFTGAAAMAVKIAYINAFNAMAEFIRARYERSMRQFNDVFLDFKAGCREASGHGRGLAHWRREKPRHLARLAAAHPQAAFPFLAPA